MEAEQSLVHPVAPVTSTARLVFADHLKAARRCFLYQPVLLRDKPNCGKIRSVGPSGTSWLIWPIKTRLCQWTLFLPNYVLSTIRWGATCSRQRRSKW
jgi:hypothetical protein